MRRAAVLLALALAACDSVEVPDDECSSLRDEFADKVWAPLMGKVCITCHQPGGLAWEQNARFSIVPATYPGFIDQNLASVRAMAGYEYNGEPLLLAKPSAVAIHGGGLQLEKGSKEYKDFKAFLERMATEEGVNSRSDGSCEPALVLPEVVLLTPQDTLRKASLALVGRLPSDAELAQVTDDASLATAVRGLLDEPAFDDWLIINWNDVLLTDLYGSYTGRSVGLLNGDDFPGAHGAYYDDVGDDNTKKLITTAVMREPLELIVHVVRSGLPFGEILTADYTMLNPYSAQVYESDAQFTGTDPSEWKAAKVHFTRAGQTIEWPHSGILSSPMVLNRQPTTATNLDRHRAWWVLNTFLATDILTVADRPVDPDAASKFDYPWRQDSQCVVCHSVIDPIAGAFAKFDNNDQERYFPDKAPPPNVFDPGFGELKTPAAPEGGPLRWLARQITADRRFPLAMARLTFRMLTGREPVEHPRHPEDPGYLTDEAAWRDFDHVISDVTTRFEAAHEDYRELVVALVMTPYFRAAALGGEDTPDADRVAELGQVGTARLLTPELLDKKITATTGLPWSRSWDKVSWLMSDFDILYGGIDSDKVTQRLTVPNGVMAAVQARMANEVACAATPWDFTKERGERLLFTEVELTDVPTTPAGDDVPASIQRIKQTIVHLFERLLGEHLASDDAEVTRAYELFREVAIAGRAAVADHSDIDWLRCSAKKDPLTGQDLPAERRVERDVDYSVRAWMAVMTYLLSDYRYLYE